MYKDILAHIPDGELLQTPVYVSGTASSTRPRKILKHDDCFAVLDSHADIGASGGGPDGIFFRDTRYISRLEMSINNTQPLLLGSNVRDDNSMLTVDLTNPDIYIGENILLPKDMIHIVRTLFVWRGAVYQRVRMQNHSEMVFTGVLAFDFSSDFADLFEVRGAVRARRGTSTAELIGKARVALDYYGLDSTGLDNHTRRTNVAFDPVPTKLTTNSACYQLELQPREIKLFFVTVSCDQDVPDERPLAFRKEMRAAFQAHKVASRGMTTISTSNPIFNEMVCRSMADLAMLTTETAHGPYPYAGIPWYSTTFGRDGIITAIQMLWCNSRIAKGVLLRLAAYQAKKYDPYADAEPGKILHEMRGGEMAAMHEVPFGLYYGSVDTTPLFVMLAGLYIEHTGDIETLRELWPAIQAALEWIDGPGDPDQDGFIEYDRANQTGLVNQGWKDSYDAIFHLDGTLAKGPIALCEVQGYVYAAKRLAGRSARRLRMNVYANELDLQAATLAKKFEDAFWCHGMGTYVVALDGDKRQCRVRTSNAGQVLFSGIADQDRAETVTRDLMRPSFFSGWGIRTVAREEKRYNPMSYHNGSVWPHDNSIIAAGFARYGQKDAIEKVFKGMYDAASYMDLRRLPELYCGFQRGRQRGPTLYPVACSPQAWAAGAPLLLLQSTLGLEVDFDRNEILLRKPRLPSFLDEVILRNLHLGQSSIDLMLHRRGDDVSLQVLRNEGQIRVAAVYS